MAEYIEREALFKFADAIEQDFLTRNERPVFDLDGIRYLAQQLPSADVVPVVHGRWVQEKPNREVRCSLCSDIIGVGDFDLCVEGFNYCSSCGARMDGE